MNISWFVIEHPDIKVQRGLLNLADGTISGNAALSPSIVMAHSFVPTPHVGNGYSANVQATTLHVGLHIQRLVNTTTVQLRRGNSWGDFFGSWFVVEKQLFTPPWIETAWQNTLRIGDPFHHDLSLLDPDTDYEFQCQARLAATLEEGPWSASETFKTLP